MHQTTLEAYLTTSGLTIFCIFVVRFSISPKIMIRPREATVADIPQIRDINHYYIVNTSLTFATTPPPIFEYEDRLRDLKRRRLPFLVLASDQRKTHDGADLVLGYAYLSPFRGHLLAYAPTVELSIFMHPDERDHGLGTILLEAIMNMVRDGQVEHRCEERVGDIGSLVPGGSIGVSTDARVRNVIAVVAIDPDTYMNGEGLRTWYTQRGFVEKGRLDSVGEKNGKW